jgi:photosystem II stability/assembly factor-like uncharacterized protein
MVADFVSLSKSAMKYFVALLLFSVPLHAQTGVWKASPLPVPVGASYSLIDFADSANGWVFSKNGRYVLTSDGGMTWSGVRSLPDSLTVVQSRLYDRMTGLVLAQIGQGFWPTLYLLRTTDGCTTWRLLNLPARAFVAGAVSIASRHELGVLTDSGAILRSSDIGTTWDTLAPKVPHFGDNMAIMKNGRIFLSSVLAGGPGAGRLFTSSDRGVSWDSFGSSSDMGSSASTLYNGNLACFDLYFGDEFIYQDLVLYNSAIDSILTPNPSGSSGNFLGPGVFYDDGTSFVIPLWYSAMGKKSGHPTDSLYVIQSETLGPRVSALSTLSPKFAWILSDSNTVFRRVDLLTDLAQKSTPPGEFRLLQNYPNPFNPTTTIRYALPNRSRVTLSVFNTLGQQVATLVNDTHDAGYHEVRFDGTGLASGVYFYRFRAGEYVATKRLLLIR